MAVVQLRNPTKGRAYYDRKVAAGKTPMEAMRALKRRLSDIVYHQMITDARACRRAREDTWGRLLAPARPAQTPVPAPRRSHFPDPPHDVPTPGQARSILLAVPGALHQRRTAAAVKRTLLDDGEDRRTLFRPGMTPLDTEGSHDRASPPMLRP